MIGRTRPDAFCRILLTMVNPRVKHNRDYTERELERFKDQMMQIRIRQNDALYLAQAFGQAIFDFAPRSNGARDYAKLCDEILNHEKEC